MSIRIQAPMTQTGLKFAGHAQPKEGQIYEWITIQSKKAKKEENRPQK
jgi:hypothetical protein